MFLLILGPISDYLNYLIWPQSIVSVCVLGALLEDGIGIPVDSRWWTYLYATLVLAICLIVCLIGGAMFARTSIVILCVSIMHVLSLNVAYNLT